MAEAISLRGVGKTFADGTRAVANVDIKIDPGELLVLVGPSGCGKSTLLRMIAGLETITEGEIEIAGRVVNGLAPKDRDTAMVFQNYALYPHMTVAENIGFGLRIRRLPRTERERLVRQAAELLELTQHLGRRPGQLSGGQRQRVAIGRAIVRSPKAFLMDEPLSNLDAKLRAQMRSELSILHERLETTTVYVTHDQIEAMTLGTRVAVLRPLADCRSNLQQVGSPREIYDRPANVFVASFLGSPTMNLLSDASYRDGTLTIGAISIDLGDHPAGDRTGGISGSRRLVVGVRPERLVLATPGSSTITGRAAVVEQLGSEALVHVETDQVRLLTAQTLRADESVEASGDRVVAKIAPQDAPRLGDTVSLRPEVDAFYFFDAETGLAL